MEKINIKISFKKVGVTMVTLAFLSLNGCTQQSTDTSDNWPHANIQQTGLLLPHHLLVEYKIREYYETTKDPSIEYIVLISPNHFGHGFSYLQSSTENENSVPPLAIDKINELSTTTQLKIENKLFYKEHGINTHYPFITEYFPNAKVIPIIIKKDTPQEKLDQLAAKIQTTLATNKTFVIASIDFTHYTDEETALLNDQRTTKWLDEWPAYHTSNLEELRKLAVSLNKDRNTNGVAMDSPESLYLTLKILEKKDAPYFATSARTSSNSLSGITDISANTSHIFGIFYERPKNATTL